METSDRNKVVELSTRIANSIPVSRIRDYSGIPINLWASVAIVLVFAVAWFALSDRLSIQANVQTWLVNLIIAAALLFLAARIPIPAILHSVHRFALTFTFLLLAFLALRLLNYALMSVPFTKADGLLHSLDQWIGFDWRSYAKLADSIPGAMTVLNASYKSLIVIAFATLSLLLLLGRHDRASEYIQLVFWNGLIITVIGAVFPADGSVAKYASDA